MASKYVRKFPVKLEGQEAELFVASLQSAQTEEFLEGQEAARKLENQEEREKALIKNMYQLLVNGLNNITENGTWTRERINAEFDKPQIDAMVEVIMEKSGLSRPNPPTPVSA